jgi:hypothetical protein
MTYVPAVQEGLAEPLTVLVTEMDVLPVAVAVA